MVERLYEDFALEGLYLIKESCGQPENKLTMPQYKYKPSCNKLSYNSEQGAWEHVVYWKRKGYDWQRPYKCKCGKWHLTRKWFDGKVPVWVKEYAERPYNHKERNKRERQKYKNQMISLAEQRELVKNLNNQPTPFWKRLINTLTTQINNNMFR